MFFRYAITGILIGSMILTLFSSWQLATSHGGRFLIARAESELKIALNSLTSSDISQEQLEEKLGQEIGASPRDWVVIQSLRSIADHEDYDLSDDLLERLKTADETDHTLLKTAAACGRCAWDSSACDFSFAMACGMTISMTPIGDIAGISRAGLTYSQGGDVDDVDAVLSVVGLSATALAVASGGSSLTIKAGAGFLKFAYLTGKLPASITRVLRTAARNGIDWSKLSAIRSTDDISNVIRMAALRPAIDTATSLGSIVNKTGSQQGLYLLQNADDVACLTSALMGPNRVIC